MWLVHGIEQKALFSSHAPEFSQIQTGFDSICINIVYNKWGGGGGGGSRPGEGGGGGAGRGARKSQLCAQKVIRGDGRLSHPLKGKHLFI